MCQSVWGMQQRDNVLEDMESSYIYLKQCTIILWDVLRVLISLINIFIYFYGKKQLIFLFTVFFKNIFHRSGI